MDDSDSDYERESIRPRGLTGLQNLGNTCYLNSALQSLSNCPPLTQYFLDCESLIRPDKSPMLSRSYLKLITELWHKKRPSYVVPSGIVSGIKAVHPMFRGFTQQDAQEFLRCLMDQLHEELKSPVLLSDDSDDEEDDDINDDGSGDCQEDNTNNAGQQTDATDGGTSNVTSRTISDQKSSSGDCINRRPSFDSTSSQSELDYETCDSGLSSERSSQAGRDIGSSDENVSDINAEAGVKAHEEVKRSRKLSALSAGSGTEEYYTPSLDMIANTKEMKETANLLEKETEMKKGKVYMEGGDSREQGTVAAAVASSVGGQDASTVIPREGEVQISQKPRPTASHNHPKKTRKLQNLRHDSIISQTFDGKILSSVRCLNCETVSTTKETFQDLSLPIPSKDHLHMLHSGYPSATGGGVSPPKGGACGEVNQGWLSSMLSWMKSWFVGPTVTLQDCLAAFFSADELKGDNMYSCGKCKKLRNGLKYSKVLELPEILSIHLKRFRHEFYSSKINTYISFPLEGLDMDPYSDKDCRNEVTTYDLVAIICHHGTAGGGHYTAYCLNHLNGQWYEFDDQYVTEVDVSQVQNCEAYVLFYRKSNKKIVPIRQKILEMETDEAASILKFYISRQWLSRFQTFAEPGPITNMDFLCKHGGVPPGKIPMLDNLIAEIPQDSWEVLYNRFGGGLVCNHLFACKVCENESERLKQRQKSEKETFIQLNEEFQDDEYTGPVYAISMAWFREWECFVREKTDAPPEAIDNSRISLIRNGQPILRQSSDHGHLSKDMWLFLHRIYGGGPEILFRQSTGAVVKTGCTASSASPPHSQTQQQQQNNKPTLASLAANASPSPSPSTSSTYPQAVSSTSSSSVQEQTPSSSSTCTTLSSSPTSTSTSPSKTSNTDGPSLRSTSHPDLPGSHSHSHASPSKPAAAQSSTDISDSRSSAQIKRDNANRQQQQGFQSSELECKDPSSPQKSPTTPIIERLADLTMEAGDIQQSHPQSADSNSPPFVDSNHQSTPPTLPVVTNMVYVQPSAKGMDDCDDDDNTGNAQKPSAPTTSQCLESEDPENSTCPSSVNESCLSDSLKDESKSSESEMTDKDNMEERMSRISQDSGISSEISPMSEDPSCVVEKIVHKECEAKKFEDREDSSPRIVQDKNMDEELKDSTSSVLAEVASTRVTGGDTGDGCAVVVVDNAGSCVGHTGIGKEKPSGGSRRNKKKKNKSMEVTRI